MTVIDLDEWVTVKQGAAEKQVSETALRIYLRLHREIKTREVGSAVLVKRSDLKQDHR